MLTRRPCPGRPVSSIVFYYHTVSWVSLAGHTLHLPDDHTDPFLKLTDNLTIMGMGSNDHQGWADWAALDLDPVFNSSDHASDLTLNTPVLVFRMNNPLVQVPQSPPLWLTTDLINTFPQHLTHLSQTFPSTHLLLSASIIRRSTRLHPYLFRVQRLQPLNMLEYHFPRCQWLMHHLRSFTAFSPWPPRL